MITSKKTKHTTGGIPRWSPTLVLVARFSAYVWQSGRDAQFSLTYGRMYHWAGEWSIQSFGLLGQAVNCRLLTVTGLEDVKHAQHHTRPSP
jgi:hypothetical protein